MEDKAFYLLFVLAISLHNAEEALWLPEWSENAKKFHKPVGASEFRFAVLVITILALLCTTAFMLFPYIKIINYIYFGFLGAMITNVIVPHLAATVALKKYMPGLISGLLFILPVNGIIIYKAVTAGIINATVLAVSTIIVGIILITSLPALFKLGKLVKEYRHN